MVLYALLAFSMVLCGCADIIPPTVQLPARGASRDEGVWCTTPVAGVRPPCAEVEIARAMHAAQTAVRSLPHARIAARIDKEGALQLAIVLQEEKCAEERSEGEKKREDDGEE